MTFSKTKMGTIIADRSHSTAFHRNFPQRQATVILTGFLSPVFAFRLLSGNVCPGLSSQVCYHPDSGLPVVLLPELLPSEVLADGAPFCPSYGLHCCFPPMVKRFRLSPLSVSGKFSVAEAPCYLSAVWLNLPKNTLQRLVFVGFRRCYPPGSGSGSSGKRVFTRAVWLASQLSFAFLSLTFRTVFYRSPDGSKIIRILHLCNFSGIYFTKRN